jgi:hypothetical protein
LPDDQGAVWFALETDDWFCQKLAGIGRAKLDSAKLQHFVSTAENVIGRDPFPRLIGALAPYDRQLRDQR